MGFLAPFFSQEYLMFNDPSCGITPGKKTTPPSKGIGSEFQSSGKIPQSDDKQVCPRPKESSLPCNDSVDWKGK